MYCDAGTVSSMLVGESRAPRGTSTEVPPSETVPPKNPMFPDALWVWSVGHTASVTPEGGGGSVGGGCQSLHEPATSRRAAARHPVSFRARYDVFIIGRIPSFELAWVLRRGTGNDGQSYGVIGKPYARSPRIDGRREA